MKERHISLHFGNQHEIHQYSSIQEMLYSDTG